MRRAIPLTLAVLALAACGGGGGGPTLALGTETVVDHADISGGANAKPTKLGVTVLKVRKGTQQELKSAGFEVEDENKDDTPYYVDVRYRNAGQQTLKRNLDVSLEDGDGNLITATTIFNFGNVRFAKCPAVNEGELEPGQSYESCTLFLVPPDKDPAKVSFLPNNPGQETDFVYWDAG